MTLFQRERVDPLVQEFFNRFGPKQPEQKSEEQLAIEQQQQQQQESSQNDQSKLSDQPAEKKMKMNTR